MSIRLSFVREVMCKERIKPAGALYESETFQARKNEQVQSKVPQKKK